MRAEMPGRRAAHAETANHDAVRVDLVLAFHRIERLEQVHLAGELVGVGSTFHTSAARCIGRREFARIALVIGQESSPRSKLRCVRETRYRDATIAERIGEKDAGTTSP